jgi:hypothetical protein
MKKGAMLDFQHQNKKSRNDNKHRFQTKTKSDSRPLGSVAILLSLMANG